LLLQNTKNDIFMKIYGKVQTMFDGDMAVLHRNCMATHRQ